MINLDPVARFRTMSAAMPDLASAFAAMTRAHLYFQGSGQLKAMSVSDVLDNGSIEATFHGVRIKFEMLPVFGPDRRARGRIVCIHCHCVYGQPAQAILGAFTFDEQGETDLQPDGDGIFPNLKRDGAAIIVHFMDVAMLANKSL